MSLMVQIANDINQLGSFCGQRDLERLTCQALFKASGKPQVDWCVLFGGSILAGGDLLATAMEEKLAKHFLIVGGQGHTTKRLQQEIAKVLKNPPNQALEKLSEAELFALYLQQYYGVQPDFLETKSTNCGNNITLMLDLIAQTPYSCQSILLMQDATMQRRMTATLKKYATEDLKILNYATYDARVQVENGKLHYQKPILGMWEIAEYRRLLMGEIPRLTDDATGYGPKGANYLVHVEIPVDVTAAFQRLLRAFPDDVRTANPAFRS